MAVDNIQPYFGPGARPKGATGTQQPYGGTQPGQPEGTQNFGGGPQSGKGTAKPPDYYGAARADELASQRAVAEQTGANRPGISTDFMSQNWTRGPNGEWQLSSGLTGPYAEAARGYGTQAASMAGTPLPTGEEARKAATDAVYGQYTSRMDPQWGQREEATRGQLLAQGLDPSSPAFATEMARFSRERNDAYDVARRSAVGQGMQAQEQQFQQGVTARELPTSMLQRLQQLSAAPQFSQAGQYMPAQYAQAAQALGQYGLTGQQIGSQKGASTAGGITSGVGAAAVSAAVLL